MDDELIQYYVVNSELNMSPGKIATQVVHVATLITLHESIALEFHEWFNKYNQKKIILRGKQKDLEKLVKERFYFVRDIGLTKIPPNSLTCVGSGVMWRSEAQKYVKRLQLL
jgi:PTH2 family peptidyl-tRNA hydrolase